MRARATKKEKAKDKQKEKEEEKEKEKRNENEKESKREREREPTRCGYVASKWEISKCLSTRTLKPESRCVVAVKVREGRREGQCI